MRVHEVPRQIVSPDISDHDRHGVSPHLLGTRKTSAPYTRISRYLERNSRATRCEPKVDLAEGTQNTGEFYPQNGSRYL